MSLSLFIARRLYFKKDANARVTKLAIRIATAGVGIGLAVMILSVCVVMGFKREISQKVLGFGSHIQVVTPETILTPDAAPLHTDSATLRTFAQVPGVAKVARFSNKMGILKTDEDFKAVLLKGIEAGYDTAFIHRHLTQGYIPAYDAENYANDIVISQQIADEMKLQLDSRIYAYFFEGALKTRRFRVVGIYETHMSQFDESIILCNLHTVNKLNRWSVDESSGMEIQVNDFDQLERTYAEILPTCNRLMLDAADTNYDNRYSYVAYTIRDLYAQIFDWLTLLDLNIWVILCLMVCVAGFTMISGLLILILEKTQTIGVLKALGATNGLVRRVFINYAVLIMGRGLLVGNLLGLGIAALQAMTGLIKLDAKSYYVDSVPIVIDPMVMLLLNGATLAICTLALVGPTLLITHIRPAKAIKFD